MRPRQSKIDADYRRKSLTNLSHFLTSMIATNLQNIDASENFINNLDDLQPFDFDSLQSLNVACNLITDINGIAEKKFPKLLKLYINGNQISDLHPLQSVSAPKLRELRIGFSHRGNLVSNIEPLTNKFPLLQQLTFDWNKLTGIGLNPLKQAVYPNLKRLYLTGNNIDFLNPKCIEKLQKLEALSIKSNCLTNMRFMSKLFLYHLQFIDLSSNQIRQISEISHTLTPKLARLSLSKNQISDYRDVIKCNWENISSIYLYDMKDIYEKSVIKQFRKKKMM